MSVVANIVQHTPIWVFVLLAVLLTFGIQSTRDRTVPLWRLLTIPGIFLCWAVLTLVRYGEVDLSLWWTISLIISALVSWNLGSTDGFRFVEATGGIAMRGSVFPLLRNLVLFFAKYVVTAAIAISAYDRAALLDMDVVISGISAGYFIGWLGHFFRWYFAARATTKLRIPAKEAP